jgi:hypothetical protein
MIPYIPWNQTLGKKLVFQVGFCAINAKDLDVQQNFKWGMVTVTPRNMSKDIRKPLWREISAGLFFFSISFKVL